ncbi:mariner Mos1 transposase [Trichonephila clavipes]|nr:mariner Mos1 transposase [Trichonephila clavipes]
MGMIQKQGNWVAYEMKPKDVERRVFACEQLLARQRRKGFLHRIVTGDEKWVRYDNPKRKKSWGYPGHASTSTAKPNIHGSKVMFSIWWDQLGVVYYELLKPTETITGDRYRTQLMRLSRALNDKQPQYNKRHKKVILQHDNTRPHVSKVVKTYLETFKWEILPHPLYSPDLAPSGYHLFRSMAHGLADQHFRSYEEVRNWIDSWITSKDDLFFQRGIRTLPKRWEKVVASDVQYSES